jgi:hypothetical protein
MKINTISVISDPFSSLLVSQCTWHTVGIGDTCTPAGGRPTDVGVGAAKHPTARRRVCYLYAVVLVRMHYTNVPWQRRDKQLQIPDSRWAGGSADPAAWLPVITHQDILYPPVNLC